MSKKIHYIVKDTFSGCIGNKIERVKFFTNETNCHKAITELKKNNTNKRINYWCDFEWESELIKQYPYLFKNGFDIEVLNNNLQLFVKTI